MSVTLENIEKIIDRTKVGYKEAKEALEQHDGDMVEALIYLEASNKTAHAKPGQKPTRNVSRADGHTKRNSKPENDFFEDVRKFFAKMHKTSFVICNASKRVLDIPLTIAALLILFTMPVSMFMLILPYIFGFKISILDSEGKNMDFEKAFHNDDPLKAEKKEDEDRMA